MDNIKPAKRCDFLPCVLRSS